MEFIVEFEISCFHGTEPIGTLTKRLKLGFVPAAGMRFLLAIEKPLETQAAKAELAELVQIATNPTGVLTVEFVSFCMRLIPEDCYFKVDCRSASSSNLESLEAYVRLMTKYYGFARD